MLPKTIRIGSARYTVLQPEQCAPDVAGRFFPSQRVIEVARRVRKVRTDSQRRETFWHETTHAILFDMNHPLKRNEAFVTAFSRRLSRAIDSARF